MGQWGSEAVGQWGSEAMGQWQWGMMRGAEGRPPGCYSREEATERR